MQEILPRRGAGIVEFPCSVGRVVAAVTVGIRRAEFPARQERTGRSFERSAIAKLGCRVRRISKDLGHVSRSLCDHNGVALVRVDPHVAGLVQDKPVRTIQAAECWIEDIVLRQSVFSVNVVSQPVSLRRVPPRLELYPPDGATRGVGDQQITVSSELRRRSPREAGTRPCSRRCGTSVSRRWFPPARCAQSRPSWPGRR